MLDKITDTRDRNNALDVFANMMEVDKNDQPRILEVTGESSDGVYWILCAYGYGKIEESYYKQIRECNEFVERIYLDSNLTSYTLCKPEKKPLTAAFVVCLKKMSPSKFDHKLKSSIKKSKLSKKKRGTMSRHVYLRKRNAAIRERGVVMQALDWLVNTPT